MSELSPDGFNRLKQDISKKMSGKFGKAPDSDLDKLLKRYKMLMAAVHDGAAAIRNAEIDAKRIPDRNALNEIIMQQCLETFRTFDKDELIMIMSLMHAKTILDDLGNMLT